MEKKKKFSQLWYFIAVTLFWQELDGAERLDRMDV